MRQDWSYTYAVTPSRARALVDEFAAAAAEAERITDERARADQERQERGAEQLRREAIAARPPQTGRILHGVQVFGPGEPESGWANAPSRDES